MTVLKKVLETAKLNGEKTIKGTREEFAICGETTWKQDYTGESILASFYGERYVYLVWDYVGSHTLETISREIPSRCAETREVSP
jgi:hypothetical protein